MLKKVAIVGFAPTWVETPWKDEDFEVWSLNEAYKLFANVPEARADRWFEIHDPNSPSKNTSEHIKFLETCPTPIYMQEKNEKFPSSLAYPLEAVVNKFGSKYFTNSISYMIALAIYEGFEEIHVYGVDMAQSSEYGTQRPSCEYWLGVAKGLGINVFIPATSDLLKCKGLYGYDTDNIMRIKKKSRIKELKDRANKFAQDKVKAQQTILQCDSAINQITGAIDDCNYWLNNWEY